MKIIIDDFFSFVQPWNPLLLFLGIAIMLNEGFLLLSSKRRKRKHKQTDKLHTIGAYENRSWSIFPFLHSRPYLDWYRNQNKTKSGSELNFFLDVNGWWSFFFFFCGATLRLFQTYNFPPHITPTSLSPYLILNLWIRFLFEALPTLQLTAFLSVIVLGWTRTSKGITNKTHGLSVCQEKGAKTQLFCFCFCFCRCFFPRCSESPFFPTWRPWTH